MWSFIMLGCCCKLILDVILMIYRCLLFIMKFTKAVPKTAVTPAASKAATKAPPKGKAPAAPKAATKASTKAPPKVKATIHKKASTASESRALRNRTMVDNKPPPKVTLFSRVCSSNVL